MNWSDEDIDKLFKESAGNESFPYKEEYWKEFEKFLPVNKRRGDVFWYLSSFLFLALMSGMLFVDEYGVTIDHVTAKLSSNLNTIESPLSKDDLSTEKEHLEEINDNGSLNINRISSKMLNQKNDVYSDKIAGAGREGINDPERKQTTSPASFADSELNNQHDSSFDNTDEINSLTSFGLYKLKRPSEELGALSFGKPKMPLASGFYFELNSGLLQSRITPSNSIGFSYGVGAGIQLQKNKFGLTAGFGTSVVHPGDMTLSRMAKVYGFGSDVYKYELKYHRFYMLDAQLTLNYHLGRHAFGITFKPSFIYSTKVTYCENGGNEFNKPTPQSNEFNNPEIVRSVYGYMDGINRIGMVGGINYSVLLKRDIELGLNAGVQFKQQVNQSFINGINRKYPFEGQLFIRKRISR